MIAASKIHLNISLTDVWLFIAPTLDTDQPENFDAI